MRVDLHTLSHVAVGAGHLSPHAHYYYADDDNDDDYYRCYY